MYRTIIRLVLGLSILCLFIILIGALAGIDPTEAPAEEPTPTQTPTPQAPAAGQPAVSDDPFIGAIRGFLEFSFRALERADHMIQALWPLLLGLLILGLIFVLLKRTVEETQEYRLELDKLVNGTGEASFGEALVGMEALVREKLYFHIKIMLETIEKYASLTSEGAEFPSQKSLPRDPELTKSLDKVVESLGDDSPKYVKPLLSLWRYLFPGDGLRIRMTVQHDGDPTSRMGITFELLELSSQRTSKVYTIWEEKPIQPSIQPWVLCKSAAPRDAAGAQTAPSVAGEETGSSDGIPWSRRVAEALERASLYQDAITYYEKALAESPSNPGIAAALVACQNKLARQVGYAAAFGTASKLESSGLLEAAVESYTALFVNDKSITSSRERWSIALGINPGLKGAALDQLAGMYLDELNLHDEAVELFKRAVHEGHTSSSTTLERIQKEQADSLVEASQWLLENEQWLAAETYLAKAIANFPEHPGAVRLQETLKTSMPVQEDKEALAAFNIAQVYRQQGRHNTAAEFLVKALEKQPTYEEAQEVLGELLAEMGSLRSRFVALLDNAMVWLAIELFRHETDRKTNNQEVYRFKQAQYHNFYGAYLLSVYESFPSSSCLAAEDFVKATEASPLWLFPYEYLGDLYGLVALYEQDEQHARRLLKKASAWYEIALEKKVLHPSGDLTDITPPIRMRIKLDRFAIELLGCPTDASGLWTEILQFEETLRQGKQKLEEIPISKAFEEVYFSLAFLYALVAYREEKSGDASGCPHPKEARLRAGFYLTCAALIETNRLAEADYNPILAEVLTDRERRDLANSIEIEQYRQKARRPKQAPTWENARQALREGGFDVPENFLKEA